MTARLPCALWLSPASTGSATALTSQNSTSTLNNRPRAKRKLRCLIACEFSGVVREAFRAEGWDAWSCDLRPTEIKGQHIQGNVEELLAQGGHWDLIICHPTCTNLANSSAKHLYLGMKKENGPNPARWKAMREGAAFFLKCYQANAPYVAVENPIMLGHAQRIIGAGPSQVVQPWMFGHKEVKATCLWLRGLPALIPTDNVKAETMALPYSERAKVHWCAPGPDREKMRSRTLPGLAAAMASQWTAHIKKELNLN